MLCCAHLCYRPHVRRFVRQFLLPTFATAAILALTLAPAPAQDIAGANQVVPTQQRPLPQVLSTKASLAALAPKIPKLLPGHVVIPASNVLPPGEAGKQMHTNYRIFVPNVALPSTSYPPYSGYLYETPESIACLYNIVTQVTGCNPNATVNVPNGGSQSIAIVDAYDNPTVAGDLAYFSDQMGIPFSPSQFHIVYANGTQPAVDDTGGWEQEAALDVEWAHAMAPNATIYLVEAASNADYDLYFAVEVASNLVQCGKSGVCPAGSSGKGEVSMSWGGAEYSTETSDDVYFLGNNVVFLAAAGDTDVVEFPASSPNVMGVGGTTVARNLSTGVLLSEDVWQDTGGGASLYEPLPSSQAPLGGVPRHTPDVSADGDPETGIWVYSSFPYEGFWGSSNWYIIGGTSASVQIWAGILNASSTFNGAFAASTAKELTLMYNEEVTANYANYFKDVTYGNCYSYRGHFAGAKYDLCSGIGVPNTYAGK